MSILQDTEYPVTWPIRFPNTILTPPLATHAYVGATGRNIAASAVSWNTAGGIFVLDVPELMQGAAHERSNGFSWLAIGF